MDLDKLMDNPVNQIAKTEAVQGSGEKLSAEDVAAILWLEGYGDIGDLEVDDDFPGDELQLSWNRFERSTFLSALRRAHAAAVQSQSTPQASTEGAQGGEKCSI